MSLNRLDRSTLGMFAGLLVLGAAAVLNSMLGPSASGAGGAPPAAPAASASPVADGEKPVKLGGGFIFTEGSVSDEQGNVYFVDQDNNRIMEWTIDGKISEWLKPSSYSNGMCLDSKGNLITCADEKNELWSIKPDKTHEVLVKDFKGKLLNGPNDVWIRPDGGMYITDPLYPRKWWAGFRTNAMQQPGKYVYYLTPDHKTLTPVITDLNTPNGIIGTPDGKTLYVGDLSRPGGTFSYTINDDGTLSNKKKFCDFGSDGMTIDSDGNIYTTSTTLQIFDKTGKEIYHQTPNLYCANVCFGGKDGNMLFICSRTEVYGLKMKTHRVGPQ